jgi:adenylate cyclase class IV
LLLKGSPALVPAFIIALCFGKMQKIIESLGYVLQFTYEKYRTTYFIDDAYIMLDELPDGLFVEIEGNDQNRF